MAPWLLLPLSSMHLLSSISEGYLIILVTCLWLSNLWYLLYVSLYISIYQPDILDYVNICITDSPLALEKLNTSYARDPYAINTGANTGSATKGGRFGKGKANGGFVPGM